jgi:hypothetical protein
VLDDGNARRFGDRLDEAGAAARDDAVDELALRQQRRDGAAVGGGDELDRRVRETGRGGGRGKLRGDRRIGRKRLRPTLQDHGVARLQAQTAGVGGDVGARLVDHADDSERHAHLADLEAVRAPPARDGLADRIGQGGDLIEPLRHRVDARLAQAEAVDQRGGQPALLARRDVLAVGVQQCPRMLAQTRGRDRQGGVFRRGRRRCEGARRLPSRAAERDDRLLDSHAADPIRTIRWSTRWGGRSFTAGVHFVPSQSCIRCRRTSRKLVISSRIPSGSSRNAA